MTDTPYSSAQRCSAVGRGRPEATSAEPLPSCERSSRMPDPRISDEDLIGLTRAYLTRRRGQPAPRDLESNALSFAFTRGRTKRVAAVMGVATVVIASALTAGIVLAFHHQQQPGGATGSTTQAQVRIVRFP